MGSVELNLHILKELDKLSEQNPDIIKVEEGSFLLDLSFQNGISLNKVQQKLNVICQLWKAANQDIHEIKNYQLREKVFNLSEQAQPVNNIQTQNVLSDSEDLLANEKDNSWVELQSLLDKCKELMEHLKNVQQKIKENHVDEFGMKQQSCLEFEEYSQENSALENQSSELNNQLYGNIKKLIDELYNCCSSMMGKLRRHESLMHLGFTPLVDRKIMFLDLNSFFSDVWSLKSDLQAEKSFVDANEKLNKIAKMGWCFDQQPPPCIKLETSIAIDIKLRLFGVSQEQIWSHEIFYYHEKDKEKNKCEMVNSMESSKGGLQIVAMIRLLNYRRISKRSTYTFEHFTRISWRIILEAPDNLELMCLSVPFTIRSGSTQLGPYTGAVLWYCWTQKDLNFTTMYYSTVLFCENPNFTLSPVPEYSENCTCPNSVELKKFLAMLQAKYYCLTTKYFSEGNIQCLMKILSSLNREQIPSEVLMKQILQDKLPANQSNNKSKKKFAMITWFIAACNTLNKCAKDVNLNTVMSFLDRQQCDNLLRDKPVGSIVIRISLSNVKNELSESPLALLTAHVHLRPGEIAPISIKEKYMKDLYSFLSSIKRPTVSIIWPTGKDLNYYIGIMQANTTQIKMDTNGYGTKMLSMIKTESIINGSEETVAEFVERENPRSTSEMQPTSLDTELPPEDTELPPEDTELLPEETIDFLLQIFSENFIQECMEAIFVAVD